MAESHARARADRIHEEIDIARVLEDYGYAVYSGMDREQQFPCNLHGDGHDLKPSARVYPESQSWYCFACDRARDAIATVQAVEGLEFWPAVKHLEEKYGLPPMKWEGPHEPKDTTVGDVSAGLDPDRTFRDDLHRVTMLLETATREKDLAMKHLLRFWEAVDKIAYHVLGPRGEGNGPWSETEGREVLAKLRERLSGVIAEGAS